jgi:hypothetical protein
VCLAKTLSGAEILGPELFCKGVCADLSAVGPDAEPNCHFIDVHANVEHRRSKF